MMVMGFRFFYFLLALFLSFLIYGALLFGLYLFLKPEPKGRVIVVRAVLISKEKKLALTNNPGKKSLLPQPKPQSTPKPKKTPPKGKKGTKTATTKGGEKLDFSDIFKGVNYNIPTAKVKQKAQLEKSRFKGNNSIVKEIKKEVEKSMKTIQMPNFQTQPMSGETLTSEEANEIYDKMRRVWEEVYTLPDQYIILDVTYRGGQLYVSVVRGNLPPAIQKELIHKLKQLIFTKDFSLRVRFIAKHR